MKEIIDRVSYDGNVRAIVLASAFDKIFTAGLDRKIPISHGANATSQGIHYRPHAIARRCSPRVGHPRPPHCEWAPPVSQIAGPPLTHQRFQAAITAIEKCFQPVICAINGIAVGLAIDLASACDIRLCTDDVTMGIFVSG